MAFWWYFLWIIFFFVCLFFAWIIFSTELRNFFLRNFYFAFFVCEILERLIELLMMLFNETFKYFNPDALNFYTWMCQDYKNFTFMEICGCFLILFFFGILLGWWHWDFFFILLDYGQFWMSIFWNYAITIIAINCNN